MSPCAIYHRNTLSLAADCGQPEVSTPAGPRKDSDGLLLAHSRSPSARAAAKSVRNFISYGIFRRFLGFTVRGAGDVTLKCWLELLRILLCVFVFVYILSCFLYNAFSVMKYFVWIWWWCRVM